MLALFLAGTGYLLHVRALHRSHVDPLERDLSALKLSSSKRFEPRRLRGEYYLNQFISGFPQRQAGAAAELLSLYFLSGPLTADTGLQVSASGISLRFLVFWQPGTPDAMSLRLQNRMQKSPLILRLDRCPGEQTCLRGLFEVP